MALFSSQKNLAEQVLSTNKFQKQSFLKKTSPGISRLEKQIEKIKTKAKTETQPGWLAH